MNPMCPKPVRGKGIVRKVGKAPVRPITDDEIEGNIPPPYPPPDGYYWITLWGEPYQLRPKLDPPTTTD